MDQRLFKIVPKDEWNAAAMVGTFYGSGIDLQDGFIHLSTGQQYEETLRRHFAGQSNLLKVEIDADQLGSTLRWELSRGGDKFPHVYGSIPMNAVIEATEIDDSLQLVEDVARVSETGSGASGNGVCPVCLGRTLIEIRGKLQCERCHTICETCCEGGRC